MKNTQRKKLKMRVSFNEGYYKPPYPYTLRVRGVASDMRPTIHRERKDNKRVVRKQGYYKVHAGCGKCNGYGYKRTYAYGEDSECVCITEHNGLYSKKAYRF